MQQALQDMDNDFLSVEDFINQQIRNLLSKHQEMLQEKGMNIKAY